LATLRTTSRRRKRVRRAHASHSRTVSGSIPRWLWSPAR
jgi:hypothetical protein